jgi:hypothetical protein
MLRLPHTPEMQVIVNGVQGDLNLLMGLLLWLYCGYATVRALWRLFFGPFGEWRRDDGFCEKAGSVRCHVHDRWMCDDISHR